MTIVGLVVQLHNGNILFQHVREYLSPEKANLASKAFLNQISAYDNAFITKGSTSHLTGSIVVMNMYRVYYMILNDIFILAISHANDNPYEGALYLARIKRLLITASKELTEVQLMKKYNEIYFGMERILFGEDGCEVLTQRLSEVQPHLLLDTSITGQNNNQQAQSSGNMPSLPSLPSLTSSSSPQLSGVGVGGKILENLGASNNIVGASISNEQLQKQLNQLSKFESVNLNTDRSILTVSETQPKSSRHIYDPPATTTKWGGKTSTVATRVSNRVMFTLRHPNASMQNNNGNQSSLSVSSDQDRFRPESTTAEDLDLPTNNNNSNKNSKTVGFDSSLDLISSENHIDSSGRKNTLSMPTTIKKPLNNSNTPQTPDISTTTSLNNIDKSSSTSSQSLLSTSSSSTSNLSIDGHSSDASVANTILNDRSPSVSIPINKAKMNFLSF